MSAGRAEALVPTKILKVGAGHPCLAAAMAVAGACRGVGEAQSM